MPVRDQEHRGIAMPVAHLAGRLEERVHLGRGQVFPGSVGRIGLAGGRGARHLQNIDRWRLLRNQFEHRFCHGKYPWFWGALPKGGCSSTCDGMEKAGPKGRARPSCSLSRGEAGLAQRAAQLVDAREHGVAFGAAVMSIGQPLAVVIPNALGNLRQGHGFIIGKLEGNALHRPPPGPRSTIADWPTSARRQVRVSPASNASRDAIIMIAIRFASWGVAANWLSSTSPSFDKVRRRSPWAVRI